MKVPESILEKFEAAAKDVDFGSITLTLFVKNGKKRYVVAREESFLTEESDVVASPQVLKTLEA